MRRLVGVVTATGPAGILAAQVGILRKTVLGVRFEIFWHVLAGKSVANVTPLAVTQKPWGFLKAKPH